MSAAVDGTFILTGQSGRSYMVGAYFPDAAAGIINFDQGAGAGAATGAFKTFDENVVLTDICLGTGTTPAALQFRLTLNGNPTSQLFRVALQLSSVAFRPRLNLPIPKGARLGGIMVA